ncbi:hypothetical protein COO60DRAFT_1035439 [Scenedesmus sp. NREL 46B-D3]|nr:hypothetical protein COO60DRAFT_1035439 [Scenedesmus sp. NREL 46B-D3]
MRNSRLFVSGCLARLLACCLHHHLGSCWCDAEGLAHHHSLAVHLVLHSHHLRRRKDAAREGSHGNISYSTHQTSRLQECQPHSTAVCHARARDQRRIVTGAPPASAGMWQ